MVQTIGATSLTESFILQAGLVTEVFPAETFQLEVSNRLRSMSKLPSKTVKHIKKLVRDMEREKLHEVIASSPWTR